MANSVMLSFLRTMKCLHNLCVRYEYALIQQISHVSREKTIEFSLSIQGIHLSLKSQTAICLMPPDNAPSLIVCVYTIDTEVQD